MTCIVCALSLPVSAVYWWLSPLRAIVLSFATHKRVCILDSFLGCFGCLFSPDAYCLLLGAGWLARTYRVPGVTAAAAVSALSACNVAVVFSNVRPIMVAVAVPEDESVRFSRCFLFIIFSAASYFFSLYPNFIS